jgi:hypothetical protein
MAIELAKKLPTGFTAGYARPYSSPSLRFDTGNLELTVALYKDADARFGGAEPAGFDRLMFTLSDEERSAILDVVYAAIAREGYYADGEPRDPDPEKLNSTKESEK